MGEMDVTLNQQPGRLAALRAAAFAVASLLSLPALAEPLTIYLFKEIVMSVYSNVMREHVEYTVVHVNAGVPRHAETVTTSTAEADSISSSSSSTIIGPSRAIDDDNLVGWAASCKGVTKAVLDQRAVQWQKLVDKHAKARNVPVALVSAVMRVESCFNPRAVSRTGARGLMQLMPEPASQFGVRDSFDAEQNISGGVRYLRQLLERFKNITRLAVAAYNAGPSAVDAYRGVPPFPETRSYVTRVIAEYRQNSSQAATKPKRSKT